VNASSIGDSPQFMSIYPAPDQRCAGEVISTSTRAAGAIGRQWWAGSRSKARGFIPDGITRTRPRIADRCGTAISAMSTTSSPPRQRSALGPSAKPSRSRTCAPRPRSVIDQRARGP
jgi:hypothetical protein